VPATRDHDRGRIRQVPSAIRPDTRSNAARPSALLKLFGVIAQQPSKSPNRFRVTHIAATRTTNLGARCRLRSPQLPIRLNKLSTRIRHQLRTTLLLSLASNTHLGRKLLLTPDAEPATLPPPTNIRAGHPRRELFLVSLPPPRPKIRTPTIRQLLPPFQVAQRITLRPAGSGHNQRYGRSLGITQSILTSNKRFGHIQHHHRLRTSKCWLPQTSVTCGWLCIST